MIELAPNTNQKNRVILRDLRLLKNVKFDYSQYGKLPFRDDMLLIQVDGIEKQWNKLRYLRKHLNIVNKYIQNNKGEKLNDWLAKNNETLSDIVLREIGEHTNETGGIAGYFLNLQNYYDMEEEKYDSIEKNAFCLDDVKENIEALRKEREEKRKTRKEVRKLQLRDLKKDGKGYLLVTVDEPKEENNIVNKNMAGTDIGKQNIELKSDTSKSEIPIDSTLQKANRNISIWIAGTLIIVTGIAIISSMNANK